MDRTKSRREFKTTCMQGDLLENAVRAKALVVRFLHRALGVNVP